MARNDALKNMAEKTSLRIRKEWSYLPMNRDALLVLALDIRYQTEADAI